MVVLLPGGQQHSIMLAYLLRMMCDKDYQHRKDEQMVKMFNQSVENH